jgi:hypothetical protein
LESNLGIRDTIVFAVGVVSSLPPELPKETIPGIKVFVAPVSLPTLG